jgi:hypothetical protein
MLLPGLSGLLWPIHPHPLPDELLSSWLVRLARANGLKVQTLTRMIFGGDTSIWTRDIDTLASDEFLAALSRCTGATPDEAFQSTLKACDGSFTESITVTNRAGWILPLGIYHRIRKRCGLQICPICLQTDPEPYFRRSWRLAFVTECPVHEIILHDCCPQCGSAIMIHRGEMGKRRIVVADSIRCCANCGFDLAFSPATRYSWHDWKLCVSQRSLMMLHWSQTTPVQSGSGNSAEFFHAWMLFANLLISRRIVGRRLLPTMVESFPNLASTIGLTQRHINLVPPLQRMAILEAALALLMDWPNQMFEWINAANLTRNHLKHMTPHWPSWVLVTLLTEARA